MSSSLPLDHKPATSQEALLKLPDSFLHKTTLSAHTQTWVEINQQHFHHNIAHYRTLIPSSNVLAPVIKSNAYGHGLFPIAQCAQHNPTINYICVASAQEALQLRAYGITKPIVVLNIIDAPLEDIIMNAIDVVVYDKEQAKDLNKAALKLQRQCAVHIKIDTGLSRLGTLWTHAEDFLHDLGHLPGLWVVGIFTHFAQSERTKNSFTHLQLERFNAVLAQARSLFKDLVYIHVSCSAALSAMPESHYTFCRLGIGIYGLWPSAENKIITQQQYPHLTLKPVLAWKTKIIQIKTIPENSYVGYDCTYYTASPRTIGVLPVGYWDGYNRKFSNKGHVVINNKTAPIIGRIAMNITMVDITDIPEAQVGVTVSLLDDHHAIHADTLAGHSDTINYEIVTQINPLIPRIII